MAGIVLGCQTETAGAHPASASIERRATADASFFGHADQPIRRVLATAPIDKVTKGSGGRSLAFKLSFSGDVQGYFKPEQRFAAHWFSELASYYLDRELGLGRVPPAIGRRIEWARLKSVAGRDERLPEVVVRDGSVRGSVVWWVPGDLTPLALPKGWESWLRVDGPLATSPFTTVPSYLRALKRGGVAAKADEPPIPSDFADRPAELSDLIVFDYLIGNLDRWGGGQTNVRTLGAGKPLIFLDNANGFHVRNEPSRTLEARLLAVQRFRKATVLAVRNLDVKRLEQRMKSDPLAPLLSDVQLRQLAERQQRVVAHIAEMQRRYGAQATPW